MPLVVTACQIAPDVERPGRLEPLESAVRAAVAGGARLVVLPELAASGCCFATAREVAAASEGPDGPTATLLRRLTAELDVVVVCGYAERTDGLPFNSALVADRGEVVGNYRKVHLWDEEVTWFAAADQPPLVVDTRVGRLGVMICYDLEFPEWPRLAAQLGAQVLAVPANWPLKPRPAEQPAIEVAKAQAVAAAYGVHVIVADRCGAERGTDWVGGSLVCDRTGYLIAGPATAPGSLAVPTTVSARLDPATAVTKRLSPHNDALTDRRPELYREPTRVARRASPA